LPRSKNEKEKLSNYRLLFQSRIGKSLSCRLACSQLIRLAEGLEVIMQIQETDKRHIQIDTIENGTIIKLFDRLTLMGEVLYPTKIIL